MKITLIRHAKVLFKWRSMYNSKSFDLACHQYDSSPVEEPEDHAFNEKYIYLSTLKRTEDTVNQLSSKKIIIKTELLNEVPLSSFTDTSIKLPTIFWLIIGRIQWYFNHSRQKEGRKSSKQKINLFLDTVLRKKQDCIVVGHGFYFAQMITEMKKRNFIGDMRKRINNNESRVFYIKPIY